MSQSENSQVIVDREFEGVIIRFAYPSFDYNINPTSTKYNHIITLEQAKYIRDKLNEILNQDEIHSKLMNYDLCNHCPYMNRMKAVVKDYDTSKQTKNQNIFSEVTKDVLNDPFMRASKDRRIKQLRGANKDRKRRTI